MTQMAARWLVPLPCAAELASSHHGRSCRLALWWLSHCCLEEVEAAESGHLPLMMLACCLLQAKVVAKSRGHRSGAPAAFLERALKLSCLLFTHKINQCKSSNWHGGAHNQKALGWRKAVAASCCGATRPHRALSAQQATEPRAWLSKPGLPCHVMHSGLHHIDQHLGAFHQ